jgi:cytochrome c peroxidase
MKRKYVIALFLSFALAAALYTKTFNLRGIKDSPPYLHDGRLLTLEDTVEFFNLIVGTRLNDQEKKDLVAFMRQL